MCFAPQLQLIAHDVYINAGRWGVAAAAAVGFTAAREAGADDPRRWDFFFFFLMFLFCLFFFTLQRGTKFVLT